MQHSLPTAETGIGAVFDIAQDSDGWLWLTASRGVFRYDGHTFQPVSLALGNAVRDDDVLSAYPSPRGGVWLTTRTAGLIFWKSGAVPQTFKDRRCTPTSQMGGMIEESDSTLWFQSATGLFRQKRGVCQQVGATEGYPGGFVAGLSLDSAGTVWVEARTGQLLRLPKGAVRFEMVEQLPAPSGLAFMHSDAAGKFWVSDGIGIHLADRNRQGASSRQAAPQSKPLGNFTFRSNGELWFAMPDGVHRLRGMVPDGLSPSVQGENGETVGVPQGLSSNVIYKIFEDRERNVWVGTSNGLDQFHPALLHAVTWSTVPERQFGVVVDGSSHVWTGNAGLPASIVSANGKLKSYKQVGGVLSMRRDRKGVAWASDLSGNTLWRLSAEGITSLHLPETTAQIASFDFDRDNAPWVSLTGGRTLRYVDHAWIDVSAALAKRPGVLGSMVSTETGQLYFAFSNKIVHWDGSHFDTFIYPDGPLNVSVSTMASRGNHIWLAGRGGIDLFSNGQIHRMYFQDDANPGRVSGLVETAAGELWINGFSGLTRVASSELAKWQRDPAHRVVAERLDANDNLPGFSTERLPEPSIIEAPDSSLWIATSKGLAWLYPTNWDESQNRVEPHVEILSVSTANRTYYAPQSLNLVRNDDGLVIAYTATSLSIPSRVRFRYKMEGLDRDWQQAGDRRQAFYTKLPPGTSHFVVQASNNDGVWNTTNFPISITIQRAFYESLWFRALVVAIVLALVWLLSQIRAALAMRRLEERMSERAGERERIAQELHDTLLQSVYGLSLRYSTIVRQLPEGDRIREALLGVLKLSDDAMNEGRARVLQIHYREGVEKTLIERLTQLTEQLQTVGHLDLELELSGLPVFLGESTEEEIFLIAREAVMNAVRHSEAQLILIAAKYLPRRFELSVRDNGMGIPREIMTAVRVEAHLGLSGMRERTRRLRGQLKIEDSVPHGTTITLVVPLKRATRLKWLKSLLWKS